jgi:hypothetical protein
MRKDLYSMKTLTHWLRLLALVCTCLPLLCFSQSPVVLSSANAPLIFELPLDANMVQSLQDSTKVQLATKAQHINAGMVYPEWLADASFTVTSRPRQRLAIVVAPKRGNPELSTELLLTLNNAGRRSFKPMHLMFDAVNSFASATPLGANTAQTTAQTNGTEEKPDLAVVLRPVIKFEAETTPRKTEGATATPVPNLPNDQAAVSPRSIRSASSTKTASPQKDAPSLAPPPSPPAAPVAAMPATAPTLPASAPLPKPMRPATAPAFASESALSSWMSDWSLLAGGLALLLALLYVLSRALAVWRKRRSDQVQTNFLEPKPTELAPEESGTNTVFGVSEEEANAMHARWLREQTINRN